MTSPAVAASALCAVAVAVALSGRALPELQAAPAVPDPCSLITVAELVQIVGPIAGKPHSGDIKGGDVSCEYTPAKAPAWIEVRLNDGDLASWKRRNGGKNPVAVPEFGAGAFINLDADGSTDLFTGKGTLILRVSMPIGPTSVDSVKAIARKALPRL
jgi:hypothetical protein